MCASLLAAGVAQPSALTVLRGAAGMGKTTLAQVVARRDEVVDAFYDGILWVTLGTQPKLVEIINDLCWELDDEHKPLAELASAQSALHKRLENRRCLLIIDVWRLSDLEPFIRRASSVTTLVTTRIAEVARKANDAARLKVEQMTQDQATRLLLATIPAQGVDSRTSRERGSKRVVASSRSGWAAGHFCSPSRPAAGAIRLWRDY